VFKKAKAFAEKGNYIAQYFLWTFFNEIGSPKEQIGNALEWLERSAEANYWAAQFTLAWIYYNEKFISRNQQKSEFWAKKALPKLIKSAHENDADSQFGMALFYTFGLAVDRNLDSAKKWNSRAIKNGHGEALKFSQILEEEFEEQLNNK